jgi:hypothetical protein
MGLAVDLGPPADYAVWVRYPQGADEPQTFAFHGWELVRLECPIPAPPPTAWVSRAELVLYVTTERGFVATWEVFSARTARRAGEALCGAQATDWSGVRQLLHRVARDTRLPRC